MDFKKTTGVKNSENKLDLSSTKPTPFTFSNRELDILACLLNRMPTKKMASYLSLSPATVETHIRNLFTKIGCNSRKEIIAFIEQSAHNQLIKKHSADLLIKIAFEQELKEIAKSTANTSCTIFYHNTIRSKSMILQLEKHLALAGITVSCKAWNKGKSIYSLANDKNPKKFVVYCLDHTSLAKVPHISINLIKEITDVKVKTKILPITLFLSEQPTPKNIKDAFLENKILLLSEQKNYYLLIFELLKLLVPSYNFAKTLEFFTANHDIYNYVLPLPKAPTKRLFFNKPKFSLKTSLLIGISTLLLLSIVIVGLNNFLYSSMKKIHAQHTNDFKAKEKTILINLPQRNFSFTGRKESLTQIREHLNKYRFGTISQAISGLGGVGKTQLALEFAYQSAENNAYATILWITAETENSIYNSYKEIANTLQLKTDGLSLTNMQSIIHNKLATKYKNTDLLIVLDNVPAYSEIKAYLTIVHKTLTPFLTPHILITSRSQSWPELPLMLDNFTKDEALAFVKKHLPNESIKSINKLTKTLNYFPLALGQAVSYIKNHTNINDYLELYKSKQQDYLDHLPTSTNQYNESLWKTWNISLGKLNNESKELLFISAYLAPDNVPINFFDHLSTDKRARAIAELRKYSLISLVSNQSFKIHRLLQEVIKLSIRSNLTSNINNKKLTQNIFKTDSYWLIKAISLLKPKFDFDYLQPHQWKHWSKYLPHVQAIITNIINQSSIKRDGIELYIKYAMFLLYIQNDIKHAITSWLELKALVQQTIKDASAKFIIANINVHLGNAQSWGGLNQEAIKLLNNSISTYHQTIPQISFTQRKLLNLLRLVSFKTNETNSTRKQGDLNFALLVLSSVQYYSGALQEALSSCKKAVAVLDPTQTDNISQFYLADTWSDLGNLYVYLGEFSKAKALFEKAKVIIDKNFNFHPKQARLYSDLALLEYNLGNFNKALTLLEACFKIRLKNFSINHPQQEDTFLKLGFVNYMLGNTRTAKQNLLYAGTIYKLYNDDDLIKVFINLGLWKTCESLKQYNNAMHYMDITFETSNLQFVNNVNLMISSQLSQAEMWPQQPAKTNLPYWQKAFEISRQIFNPDDYQIAKSHYMLGLALEHAQKSKEAQEHYNQALTVLRSQTAIHKKLELFHAKNIETIQERLQKIS